MTFGLCRLKGVASVCLVMLAIAPAWAQQAASPATPPVRNFDYWQPDWMVRELWGPGHMPKGMKVRLLRHSLFVQFGVPAEYAGSVSTAAAPSKDDLATGRDVYAANCSSCHGKDGMGGGEGARALSPSPALLAYMITRPVTVDEYLLWAISDGGAQFESDMPAFKDKLTRDEIWRVIAYMRAGFPGADGGLKK
ncbi:MAG: cytochrome c [Hyphomicrobiaceae bacterium]